MNKICVLDKGFVEEIAYMGGDLLVVNAAKASYLKQAEVLDESAVKLINYLAREKHWTPFAHPQLTVRIKAPISVQRQFEKHRVGMVSNSESSRYMKLEPEFYVPAGMRKQSKVNKQGSDGLLGDEFIKPWGPFGHEMELHEWARDNFVEACEYAYMQYDKLLDLGVARELARDVLPLATYVTWVQTGSLYAWANLVRLRKEAQYEVSQYAEVIESILYNRFPACVEALLEYVPS